MATDQDSRRTFRGVDPADTRNETEDERMDRNWSEMLQELRVTQTGTQILSGFLLTIAFQNRFSQLTAFQHRVYLVLVILAVLTTALGLAPVNLHRGLFRKHSKRILVSSTHLIVRFTLLGVGLVLVGVVFLLFDIVAGRSAALGATAGMVVVLLVIAALPPVVRAVKRRQDAPR